MANALLQDLAAATTLAGSDLFYVKQAGARGVKATGTQLLALVGTAYVPLAGGTMTGALTLPAGAVGTPSLLFTGAGAATGIYSAGSNDLSFAVNGVKRGTFNVDGFTTTGGLQTLNTDGFLRLGLSGTDIFLTRVSTTRLQVRTQASSPIALELNSLFTDSSNYERLTLTGVAGTSVNITAESLGTGSSNLDVVITPKGTGNVLLSTGHLFLKVSTARIEVSSAGAYQFSAGTAGQTGADVAFRRSAIGVVDVDSGTANAYRDLKLRNLLAGGGNGSYVQTPSMTVDRLADAATAGAGARAFVTDANATTFLSTVAAGGSNKVPVVSNGTNWLIG